MSRLVVVQLSTDTVDSQRTRLRRRLIARSLSCRNATCDDGADHVWTAQSKVVFEHLLAKSTPSVWQGPSLGRTAYVRLQEVADVQVH
jgi:hypothetical protein